MRFRARKALRFGPFVLNLTQRGFSSWGLRIGRWSWNAKTTRDGQGWRADIDLPHGVTAVEVIDKRRTLSGGLRRPLGCVWPEPVSSVHEGRLVLWVGDHDGSTANATPRTPPAA